METFGKSEMNSMFNHVEFKPDVKNIQQPNCRKKLDFTENFQKVNKVKNESNESSILGGKKCQSNKIPSNTKRNARERKRVRTINDYFSQLQKYLPHSKAVNQFGNNGANLPIITTNKKLSKVETLKAAIEYIEFLQTFSPPETQVYSKKNNLNILSSSNSPSSTNSSLLSSPASSTTSSSTSSTKQIYKTKPICTSPTIFSKNQSTNNVTPTLTTNTNSTQSTPSSIAIVANSSNVTFKATLSTQPQQPNSTTFTISTNPNLQQQQQQQQQFDNVSASTYPQTNPAYSNSSSNILNPIDFNINYNNTSYYYNQPQSYAQSNYYSAEQYSQKPYQDFYQTSTYYPSNSNMAIPSEQPVQDADSTYSTYPASYPRPIQDMQHQATFANMTIDY